MNWQSTSFGTELKHLFVYFCLDHVAIVFFFLNFWDTNNLSKWGPVKSSEFFGAQTVFQSNLFPSLMQIERLVIHCRTFSILLFLLSFLTTYSNLFNSSARLLNLYWAFSRYPYQPHSEPYWHKAIWPYGHILGLWPYRPMALRLRMGPIWVSTKSPLQMYSVSF